MALVDVLPLSIFVFASLLISGAHADPSKWEPWELPRHLVKHFPGEAGKLDPSRFELQIKLLTFSRVNSTLRFLESIERADYLGDRVDLEIIKDTPFDRHKGWRDVQGNTTEILEEHEKMLSVLDAFNWTHGRKIVRPRVMNGGLQAQWLEAWWPEHVNQFAVIAEDDTELSPFYYKYFKQLVMFYYYNQSNFDPYIYGITLQSQRYVPVVNSYGMAGMKELFQFPFVASWGQTMFPIPWKDFRSWFARNRPAAGMRPVVRFMVPGQWFITRGNKLWTPWQVFWAYVGNYYNLNIAFPKRLALSVSYREPGVNFHGVAVGPDAKLLLPEHLPEVRINVSGVMLGKEGEPAPDWWTYMPPMATMKRFDFCFRELPSVRKPLRSVEELRGSLKAFRMESELVVLPVPGSSGAYRLIRNWLCSLDGLNLHSYLILFTKLPEPKQDASGVASEHSECEREIFEWNARVEEGAEELVQRGHAVYVTPAEGAFDASKECSAEAKKSRNASLLSFRHLKAIQAILDLHVGVLAVSLNSLWLANPWSCLDASGDRLDYTLWVRNEASGQGVASFALWVKSSSAVLNLVTSQWESRGILDLGTIDGEGLEQFKKELSAVDLSNLSEGMARCVSIEHVNETANGAPAFVLESENWEAELNSTKNSLLLDRFDACKELVCKRERGQASWV